MRLDQSSILFMKKLYENKQDEYTVCNRVSPYETKGVDDGAGERNRSVSRTSS